MAAPPKETRSGVSPENLQELIDASVSAKHATLGNAQQYQTPMEFAEFFNSLLPHLPDSVFDPQCAGGNTLRFGLPTWTKKFGWDIDKRFREQTDGVNRLIGNCVTFWAILDDVFPDLKLECQNANPPYGLLWQVPDGSNADSTEYCWRKIMQRAHPHGFGWFISNKNTIERLGIHEHPWAYLYQTFPAGVWKHTEVEIGVVHWDGHPQRFGRAEAHYKTLDLAENADIAAQIKKYYRDRQSWNQERIERDRPERHELGDAFLQIETIIQEEHTKRPPFNIWLDKGGMIKTYLSTRFQIKRKLSREEILRVARVNDCHPLTLTTDRESRKLMAELVSCGFYTIQPEAEQAIKAALQEVKTLAAPIMPVTDFETVAYADGEDQLVCKEDFSDGSRRLFTQGKAYEISTSSYTFTEEFERNKPHYSEEAQEMYTLKHKCAITGTDRFISIVDDNAGYHRFMDKPQSKGDHDEGTLWKIFEKPDVRTVAESHKEQVEKNKVTLSTCEMLADFNFYPG